MKMQTSLCGLLLIVLACASAYAQDEELRSQTVQPAPATRDLRTSTAVKTVPAGKPVTDTAATVDRQTWLSNQLHQCEQDGLALDAQNDDLRQQVQTLAQEVDGLKQQNATLQHKLDETTHPGGSLVTAYCETTSLSRNTAGEATDCGYYACEPVSGLCRTMCNLASECDQPGHVCNSTEHECIP